MLSILLCISNAFQHKRPHPKTAVKLQSPIPKGQRWDCGMLTCYDRYCPYGRFGFRVCWHGCFLRNARHRTDKFRFWFITRLNEGAVGRRWVVYRQSLVTGLWFNQFNQRPELLPATTDRGFTSQLNIKPHNFKQYKIKNCLKVRQSTPLLNKKVKVQAIKPIKRIVFFPSQSGDWS